MNILDKQNITKNAPIKEAYIVDADIDDAIHIDNAPNLSEKFDLVSAPDGTIENKIDILFIGQSIAAQKVKQMIALSAPSQCPLLITGPSGCGKEVTAKAIHALSDRRDHPFIAVNCGAIPQELIEAELFGHSRGAFTGAHKDRSGLFEQAHGGILFLDEIGDMPMHLQVRLLRTIEDGIIRSIGGNEKKVDVRIIAATNKDIGYAIGNGEFREDLYYRLSVLSIAIPSLNERSDDIPLLTQYFMDQSSKEAFDITEAGWDILKNHDWQGNVRELRNWVARCSLFNANETINAKRVETLINMGSIQSMAKIAYYDQPKLIEKTDASSKLNCGKKNDGCQNNSAPNDSFLVDGFDMREYLIKEEIKFMQRALKQSDGVIAKSARALGMKRTTFVEKMRRYQL